MRRVEQWRRVGRNCLSVARLFRLTGASLNQTTGHWYSVTHIEKTLTVRSERSRASGEVEEQAGRDSSGLRLRSATLRPNGDGINGQ